MIDQKRVVVVGGGLAGSEAVWQLAQRGLAVDFYEMRPQVMTEAHKSSAFAEMVCSNSFGSLSHGNASAILKNELALMDAFVLQAAKRFSVPAGHSLAVDRKLFSQFVTESLEALTRVNIHREECTELPKDAVVVLATGPLTSPSLAASLSKLMKRDSLYFYDAISPIVSADSLDLDQMYFASRYGKGEADFLNVPLEREQYEELVESLLSAEVVLPHAFEDTKYFESCLPIETLAERGPKTLAFGPLKPVGLENPKTGKRPYAVIQLRLENRYRTAYNMVGFQTKMKYGEQLRIFRRLPGFERAEFLRLGSLHRNTYVDSPRVLLPTLQMKENESVFIAGQLTGTEGYLESSATGLLAGWNAARMATGKAPIQLPEATMLGSLMCEITDETRKNFQPMNANLGVLPPLQERIRDRKVRSAAYAERSENTLKTWLRTV